MKLLYFTQCPEIFFLSSWVVFREFVSWETGRMGQWYRTCNSTRNTFHSWVFILSAIINQTSASENDVRKNSHLFLGLFQPTVTYFAQIFPTNLCIMNWRTIYHTIKIERIYRRSLSPLFFKIAVLQNFAIITKQYLCWSLFFNKVAGLQSPCLQHRRLEHQVHCLPGIAFLILERMIFKQD